MRRVLFCILLVLVFVSGGCTTFKVAEIDPATGYFPGSKISNIIINESVDLDSMNSLILVTGGSFLKGQVQSIGYFGQVIDANDLSKEIVKNGLQEKIPTVESPIGINLAYKYYKPFLWLRINIRGSGLEQYAQFILTDPATLKDFFVAEEHLDYVWKGISDQTVWYPLSNALVKYIKENSEPKNYKKYKNMI